MGHDSDEELELLAPRAPAVLSSAAASTLVAVGYGAASVATTILNKALLSTWGFDFVLSLLFAQNVLVVAAIALVRTACAFAGPRPSPWADALAFPLADAGLARAMLPVAVVCLANVWCGMAALRLSSVPVYQTIKRMSPLPAMLLDARLRGASFSAGVRLSVVIICVGAFVTGSGDLDRDVTGYACAVVSCALQALYLVLAARAADSSRPLRSSVCVAHYNALLSLPLLAAGLVYERAGLVAFAHWDRPVFVGVLLTALGLGGALSLLLFTCTLVNSATTTVVVGNAKAILTTALGFVLFGQVRLRPLGVVGIGINTAGGVMYTVVKWREMRDKPRSK